MQRFEKASKHGYRPRLAISASRDHDCVILGSPDTGLDHLSIFQTANILLDVFIVNDVSGSKWSSEHAFRHFK